MQELVAILLSVVSCAVLIVMWMISRPPKRDQRQIAATSSSERSESEVEGTFEETPTRKENITLLQQTTPQTTKAVEVKEEKKTAPEADRPTVQVQGEPKSIAPESTEESEVEDLLPVLDEVKSSYLELVEELRKLRSALSGDQR
ncbi:MAG: hypothetical protein NZ988_03975 [Thaumarchaeota archaeon]|nr:hypothetical protein [Candidatus Calditenuaceae archaeon]MDW8187188.1 hypothetical protein [Nitrososphaerota archaeon]